MRKQSTSRQLTHGAAEELLGTRFRGRYCKFHYPGYDAVYGMVDEISIQELGEPLVIIQMNNKRYEVSPESLNECLTLLKK